MTENKKREVLAQVNRLNSDICYGCPIIDRYLTLTTSYEDLLMEIENKDKPELVNTDDENYAHLPITKCPKCKRPIRMYYDPCHTFLTKACPYCGKVVRWE